jgi:hypothetical protein
MRKHIHTCPPKLLLAYFRASTLTTSNGMPQLFSILVALQQNSQYSKEKTMICHQILFTCSTGKYLCPGVCKADRGASSEARYFCTCTLLFSIAALTNSLDSGVDGTTGAAGGACKTRMPEKFLDTCFVHD